MSEMKPVSVQKESKNGQTLDMERVLAIVTMWNNPPYPLLAEIGAKFEITAQRVYQILADASSRGLKVITHKERAALRKSMSGNKRQDESRVVSLLREAGLRIINRKGRIPDDPYSGCRVSTCADGAVVVLYVATGELSTNAVVEEGLNRAADALTRAEIDFVRDGNMLVCKGILTKESD